MLIADFLSVHPRRLDDQRIERAIDWAGSRQYDAPPIIGMSLFLVGQLVPGRTVIG
jgi:hypothetical protein